MYLIKERKIKQRNQKYKKPNANFTTTMMNNNNQNGTLSRWAQ